MSCDLDVSILQMRASDGRGGIGRTVVLHTLLPVPPTFPVKGPFGEPATRVSAKCEVIIYVS